MGLSLIAMCIGLTGYAGAEELYGPRDSRAVASADSVRQVSIQMYLADLVEVDGSEQTFFADVLIAARWHDSTLARSRGGIETYARDNVWAPNLLVVNQRDVSSSLPDVVRVDPDGNAQYTMRLTGDFSATLNLRNFPRDRQRFHIWVVAPPLGGEMVELLPDTSLGSLRNETLSIADWNLGELQLQPRAFQTTPNAASFSGVTLAFEAERRLGYYIIQVLLPLTAIVLMAWTVFWIDPSVVPTRVGVVVTTMLTIIAYRFMLGNLVPRLSYLTKLDYYMLWMTALVVLTLFAMAGSNFLRSRGREDVVKTIDRTGRLAFPLVHIVLTIWLWVL